MSPRAPAWTSTSSRPSTRPGASVASAPASQSLVAGGATWPKPKCAPTRRTPGPPYSVTPSPTWTSPTAGPARRTRSSAALSISPSAPQTYGRATNAGHPATDAASAIGLAEERDEVMPRPDLVLLHRPHSTARPGRLLPSSSRVLRRVAPVLGELALERGDAR